MSTYTCPVVTLKREEILKNPDSDHLYYLTVPNTGYVCVIRGKDWINEDGTLKYKKAAYCAPQTIAPANLPQFEFLKEKDTDTKVRIKARKLRNINSFGLLVPVPDDTPEGTDMWTTWGLEHYEPVVEPGGDNANVSASSLKDFTKYDVENIKNYMSAFVEGEPCIAMLKINGCLHEDSLIETEGGKKEIKNIKVGDKVWAYNLENKRFELDEVVGAVCKKPTHLLRWMKLEFENQELICTEDHLILTTEGYVESGKLTENHEIISL